MVEEGITFLAYVGNRGDFFGGGVKIRVSLLKQKLNLETGFPAVKYNVEWKVPPLGKAIYNIMQNESREMRYLPTGFQSCIQGGLDPNDQ